MAALDTSKIIAVIGAGTMGAGIAQVAAKAGYSVLLYDAAKGAAQAGVDNTAKGLDKLVARGRMTAADQQALIARITPVDSIEELAPSALVIEAIIEDLGIKQGLFKQLESLCDENVILASNTSSLSISSIGAVLERPERLLGMHFFNPAPIMKLVEVISGLVTDKEVAETVFDTAAVWGKRAVHARSTPGFIVNRVARPFYAEGIRVLEEGGADIATIDAMLRESGGFRMGPFELMDLIGHDVNYAVTCSVHAAYYGDARFTPSLTQKELVDGGYLGRKTGRGFYQYNDSEKPQATTAAAVSAPKQVTFVGHSTIMESLAGLIETAGISANFEEGDEPQLIVGAARLCLTDGRMACERAYDNDWDNLVLFDLALDYQQASRIALAPSDASSTQALEDATGLFQALGKAVSVIDDVPGMCVMRAVCMLANEGSDAVNQGVCNAEAVDIAMTNGVNYPKGPLQWADEIGLNQVCYILDNLAACYGDGRYRVSPLLRRKALTQVNFHE